MAVTVAEMARTWQRRLQARQATADVRARHLRSLLPRARDLLVDGHGARTVWLFGSLAGGRSTETSDVDLAVEGLDASRYFAALADLMALFDAPVDLVRVESAPASSGPNRRGRPAGMSPRIQPLRAEIASDLATYAVLIDELSGLPSDARQGRFDCSVRREPADFNLFIAPRAGFFFAL